MGPEHERIEMHLVSARRRTVEVHDVDLAVVFETGEHTRSEVPTMSRPDGVDHELTAVGVRTVARGPDDAGDDAVTLAGIA